MFLMKIFFTKTDNHISNKFKNKYEIPVFHDKVFKRDIR